MDTSDGGVGQGLAYRIELRNSLLHGGAVMFNPVPWFSGRTARPSTTIAKAGVKPSSQMSHLQTHMGVEGPVTTRGLPQCRQEGSLQSASTLDA